MLRQCPIASSILLCCAALAQTIPLDEAAKTFAIARRISSQDGGKTWGTEVCGPMLFADSATRDVVGNQADAEGQLKRAGEVWQGRLPKSINVSNTALEWSGVLWTTVMWPLPADTRELMQLLAHECYHRIQPALKLPASDSVNSHMDGAQGRIWMLLEWRALERALAEGGEARKNAVADALLFRQYRRSLVKSAAETENRLEMNEGLAEYTGVRLGNFNAPARRAAAIFMLRDGTRRSSLVRSFAYASGPAYGLLLDESDVDWRKTLSPESDLGVILGKAYQTRASPLDESLALLAAREYGGEEVIAAETTRARKREVELADMRRRFIEGPVLVFPVLDQFSFGFNPNGLVPLNESSTVYRSLRVSDRWGVLDANSGMIIRENGLIKRVVAPAPRNTTGNTLSGHDWKLELKPGFKIGPGPRDGDLVVEKE
jgi:hypothetical protein